MLFNREEDKNESLYHKMIMLDDDDDVFKEIMENGETTKPGAMAKSFNYFRKNLKGKELDVVWNGIKSLNAVVIELERDDDVQAIFESINSTGVSLSNTDKIQNYILMGEKPKKQAKIYNNHWRKMEDKLDKEFDNFWYIYTVMMKESNIIQSELYWEFKRYMENKNKYEEIKRIHHHAELYATMKSSAKHSTLDPEIKNIAQINMDTINPLILKILADHSTNVIGVDDAKEILQLIESYMVRIIVCGGTKNLNKTIPVLISKIDQTDYVKSIERGLVNNSANTMFPRDIIFKDWLKQNSLYGEKICPHLLHGLEKGYGKGKLNSESMQVDHIMPQKLSDVWKEDLGEKWEEIYERYSDRLGNLTLTEYNPEMSNRRFVDRKTWYKDSLSRVTRKLAKFDKWDDKEIRERADELADMATTIWKYPKGYESVVETTSIQSSEV